MVAQPKPRISEEEYLARERSSITKHEYYRGQVYAMTGAKESHNLIAGNIHAALHRQLRKRPCRVYQSDMRIKVLRTGLNTYPDVVVVCGQPQFADATQDTLVNPIVIVEVLSPSTERYDRGMKFQQYRMIETLQAYLLVAQDHQQIECYLRQEHGQWTFSEALEAGQELELTCIESIVAIDDAYEKVDLETDNPDLPRDSLA